MRPTMTRRRAFTLIEMVIALAMLAVLVSVAIPVYHQVTVNGENQQALATLETAQIADRNVAYLPNNHNSYPNITTFLSQVSLTSTDTIATSASTGPTAISAYEVSSTQMLLATKSTGGNCYVLLDNTQATATWAVSATGTCVASGAASLISQITGSYNTATGGSGPSTITLP